MAKRKQIPGIAPKLPVPGFGGGGGMAQKLQQLQQQMLETQEALGNEIFEGSAGGGVVTVQVTGHQQAVKMTINPEAVDPNDVEMLQDLILIAFNEAIEKSKETASDRMGGLTGGISIPGLF
jgi:nucleoid-associated protein EbfC